MFTLNHEEQQTCYPAIVSVHCYFLEKHNFDFHQILLLQILDCWNRDVIVKITTPYGGKKEKWYRYWLKGTYWLDLGHGLDHQCPWLLTKMESRPHCWCRGHVSFVEDHPVVLLPREKRLLDSLHCFAGGEERRMTWWQMPPWMLRGRLELVCPL